MAMCLESSPAALVPRIDLRHQCIGTGTTRPTPQERIAAACFWTISDARAAVTSSPAGRLARSTASRTPPA